MKTTQRRISKKYEVLRLPDGSRRIGRPEAYLVFLKSGDVQIGKSGKTLLAEQKSLTKGFKVFDAQGRKSPIVDALKMLPFKHAGAERALVDNLREILVSSDDLKAERLIDEFASALKAVRRLRGTGAKHSNEHQRFDAALAHLAKKLGRPPTKGALARQLCVSPYEISKLAKVNGFSWLPNNAPGRTKGRKLLP